MQRPEGDVTWHPNEPTDSCFPHEASREMGKDLCDLANFAAQELLQQERRQGREWMTGPFPWSAAAHRAVFDLIYKISFLT